MTNTTPEVFPVRTRSLSRCFAALMVAMSVLCVTLVTSNSAKAETVSLSAQHHPNYSGQWLLIGSVTLTDDESAWTYMELYFQTNLGSYASTYMYDWFSGYYGSGLHMRVFADGLGFSANPGLAKMKFMGTVDNGAANWDAFSDAVNIAAY